MERELTPEERKRRDEAYRKADPTTYSEVLPAGDLRVVGESEPKYMGRTYPIVSDGETSYVEIPMSRDVKRQQAVTRILKGIVNVSDMVERDGSFYSKVMPLERIEEVSSEPQIRADILLLDVLFGDWDHDYMHDGETSQNMRVSDGKVAYFDFNEVKQDIHSHRISSFLESNEHDPDVLKALSQRLGTILGQYDSDEGRELLGRILDSVDEDTGRLFDPWPKNSAEQSMPPRERFIEGFIKRARANKALVDARLEHLSAEVTGDS